MRIQAEESLGVIIDVQEKLFPHMYEKDVFLRQLTKLISGFQILDIPIMVTEQYTRGLGSTIEPIKKLFTPLSSVEKISFSCCDEPLFMDQLVKLRRKFVLIAGMEAHICVLQTMEDLKEQGYIPVIIEDCMTSRSISDKQTALNRMIHDGALVTTCESVLFELCRHAGNERFKAISSIVK